MTLTVNGRPTTVSDSATLADLLAANVESTRGSAAAVDGAVVPRAEWSSYQLHDGQKVEILTAVQGG